MADKKRESRERQVFIFTALLVIAMFVTVAIYVYAGKQQNLPTREFSTVNVKKSLGVREKFYQQTEIIQVTDEDTMTSFEGGMKIYSINPTASFVVYLPRVSVLDDLKNFKQGRALEFYLLNESSVNNVVLTVHDDDTNRMSFIYGPPSDHTITSQGLKTIIIRKNTSDVYQVIVG